MPRINGSPINPFGGNNSYLFIEYTIIGQNYPNNTTTIEWLLGFHYGSAHFRLDNAVCAFSGGPISGDANGGPIYTGWPAPGGQNQDVILDTGTFTITHDASGQRTVIVTGSVSTDWGSSTINTSFSLPQIPQSPASPSNASATRISDSQASVTWTNHSTSTAPYKNVKVYRQTDGGGWALRTTLGVVTSYSDTGISANHRYRYRMSAVGVNTVEVGYATSNYIWTTPGAPTNCQATKLSNGNIRVTWTNNVNYSEYRIEIQESTNGGVSWSNLETSLAAGTTSYTHTSPNPAVTHRYRVRAKTSQGTTLFSSYSSPSNTITLLATANPPTNLSPSGVAVDATEDIVFRWQHNPADGTPQTKYQIEYEVDGGATVTIGPVTSEDSEHVLAGGTLSNGHTITWRVKTAGENGVLSSASATASFDTRDRPTVVIDSPASTYGSSSLTVQWTYFQAQGSPQAAWRASLYDSEGNLLEQRSGSTEDETTFTTALSDATTYTVTVTVTSSDGLQSEPDSQEFTTVFLPPAAVSINASYDAESGSTIIVITGNPAEDGVTAEIVSVDLQRKIDDESWVTFASGIVLDPVSLSTTVLDLLPTIRGTNTYRAIAYSAVPSSVTSDEVIVVTTGTDDWCFLNGTDSNGFAVVLRLRDNVQVRANPSRERQIYHFAGREKPVQLTGEATDLVLTITADLWLDSAASKPDEFESLGSEPGVVLWRDTTGRRVFGALSSVEARRNDAVVVPVSFVITELDYTEGVS